MREPEGFLELLIIPKSVAHPALGRRPDAGAGPTGLDTPGQRIRVLIIRVLKKIDGSSCIPPARSRRSLTSGSRRETTS